MCIKHEVGIDYSFAKLEKYRPHKFRKNNIGSTFVEVRLITLHWVLQDYLQGSLIYPC
jgi:hypothetical protein